MNYTENGSKLLKVQLCGTTNSTKPCQCNGDLQKTLTETNDNIMARFRGELLFTETSTGKSTPLKDIQRLTTPSF